MLVAKATAANSRMDRGEITLRARQVAVDPDGDVARLVKG